jgi:hypothetical protein
MISKADRPVDITVFVESQIAHTSQVYSGLAMLQDRGAVRVSYKAGNELRADEPLIRVYVGKKLLVFDLSDNPRLYSDTWLQRSDFYFKRMLDAELQKTDARLYPYGLNYPVYYQNDRMVYRAFLTGNKRQLLHAILRSNRVVSKLLNINLSYSNNLVHHFEGLPKPETDPRIIFYARLWNPDAARQEWKKEERLEINQTRIELVLRLRKEFGSRFIGGIQKDALSERIAPGALVKNEDEVYKGNYLKKLRTASIGIASPGLERSVGFKIAEYVAMAKAIVTTPVNCIVPGDFSVAQNYLPYTTIDQCIDACSILISDSNRRSSMMKSNYNYYQEYLCPDKLLIHAFLHAEIW